MRVNPKALALVTNKLDVVVVDDFQDVSRVQERLLLVVPPDARFRRASATSPEAAALSDADIDRLVHEPR